MLVIGSETKKPSGRIRDSRNSRHRVEFTRYSDSKQGDSLGSRVVEVERLFHVSTRICIHYICLQSNRFLRRILIYFQISISLQFSFKKSRFFLIKQSRTARKYSIFRRTNLFYGCRRITTCFNGVPYFKNNFNNWEFISINQQKSYKGCVLKILKTCFTFYIIQNCPLFVYKVTTRKRKHRKQITSKFEYFQKQFGLFEMITPISLS